MDKKLYRLKKNRMLAGVAAGMAEYFCIDATVMRLIFVAVGLAFFPLGVIAYIVAAIVMPENKNVQRSGQQGDEDEIPYVESSSGDGDGEAQAQDNRTRLVIGGILLFLGASLLTRHILPWYYARFFWPLLLLAAGGLIIYTGWRR